MGLFHKNIVCEKCGRPLEKKERKIFDTTHQGRCKDGFTIYVCHECLMELFYQSLKKFNGRAVVFAPIEGHNAYVSYNLGLLGNTRQDSRKVDHDNQKLVEGLSSLLPDANAECGFCHGQAHYSWCSSELIYNDPYLWQINEDIHANPLYLCKECLIHRFQEEMEEHNFRFEAIYPPLSDDVFLCSWDI